MDWIRGNRTTKLRTLYRTLPFDQWYKICCRVDWEENLDWNYITPTFQKTHENIVRFLELEKKMKKKASGE